MGPLAPGPYRVETSLDGFETAVRRIVLDAGQTATVDVTLSPARFTQSVVVTARRVEELAQDVPIPVSVVSGDLVSDAGAFNVNRLKEMIPTVQFYSTNPRNSAINIRGLGAPFGLTNDGLEPGVGLYIDGVFYARPASATLDFLDVDQVEVLRGPQGTLFGKNTTAGAINVTTRKPSFTPGTDFELNYGNLQFVQAKASITGPLGKKIAARLSFSGTQRDGTVYNVKTQENVNNLNNLGVRGQVLFAPSDKLAITVAVDDTRQRPDGYTQVVAGVAPTLRPANRQYAQIAAGLNYTPPSFNAFDRETDIDTPLRSNQDLGGASLTVDWKLGPGRLTSTTAWRYWDWDPSNDRDFIGLPITTISAGDVEAAAMDAGGSLRRGCVAPPELRRRRLRVQPDASTRIRSSSRNRARPPRPFCSRRARTRRHPACSTATASTSTSSTTTSARRCSASSNGRSPIACACCPVCGSTTTRRDVDFNQQVYGGLQTTNPALIALQQSILAPQAYTADVNDTNTSGQITAAYKIAKSVNAYATYATGFKSVGLNLNGVPTDAANQPVLSAATVKPEDVRNFEVGVKTEPFRGVTANLAVFDTEIKNFQAQVTNGSVGVIRGYLANAEKVRVRGAEFDGSARVNGNLSFYGAAAYTDGKYVTFTDAPPPLEDTGGPQFEDISGSVLPGISKWAISVGGEASHRGSLLGRPGSSSARSTPAIARRSRRAPPTRRYLVVAGYSLLNARVGFRVADGWTLSVWSRNLLNKDYFDLLTAAPGNTGLYVGQPGDPRTVGVTLRVTFKSK